MVPSIADMGSRLPMSWKGPGMRRDLEARLCDGVAGEAREGLARSISLREPSVRQSRKVI